MNIKWFIYLSSGKVIPGEMGWWPAEALIATRVSKLERSPGQHEIYSGGGGGEVQGCESHVT